MNLKQNIEGAGAEEIDTVQDVEQVINETQSSLEELRNENVRYYDMDPIDIYVNTSKLENSSSQAESENNSAHSTERPVNTSSVNTSRTFAISPDVPAGGPRRFR
jgi:hypothetical protein